MSVMVIGDQYFHCEYFVITDALFLWKRLLENIRKTIRGRDVFAKLLNFICLYNYYQNFGYPWL